MNDNNLLIMYIIESILSGIFATLFMDILAKVLAKRKLIYPFLTQEELGRWFLYMVKGKIFHENISTTSKLKNEILAYYISHYLIGIFLSGIYLLVLLVFERLNEYSWMALAFGIGTVILPWFWLLPSLGFGVLAKHSINRAQILRTNLINHTNFAIGLWLWMLFVHDFFMHA